MAKVFFLLMLAAVFLSATALAVTDLTGDWRASTGEDIYIRQDNNAIWYYSASVAKDENWTSVGYGVIEGNTVKLNWADIPKGNASLKGTLTLNVTSGDELQLINQTGGWGGEEWQKIKLTRITSGF